MFYPTLSAPMSSTWWQKIPGRAWRSAAGFERPASLGGGVRKARIALSGRGKRGGARVVFLFAGEDIPVFLLSVFAKNEKTGLSAEERTVLIRAAKELAADYRRDR